LRLTYVARFAENVSTLIISGVSIVKALEITEEVVGNAVYADIIRSAKESVRQGSSISAILQRYPREFPPVFTQMVYVGEQSGSLDTTLAGVVDFYRKEVNRLTDAALKLIEPVLLIVVAILVGLIMAGVLLPLYQTLTQV
jgi:type IV pilus assembly protein PilC